MDEQDDDGDEPYSYHCFDGDGCTADDHGGGESGNADGGHASFGCAWVARP